MTEVTNVVIAGLGGQGVLTASDILAQTAFLAGAQVKKSEVHGMSQRGGSVRSDVRFGRLVFSPMIPAGEADALVVLDETQVALNQPLLRPGGVLVTPASLSGVALPGKRSLNVALLGVLSAALPGLPESAWTGAVRAAFPPEAADANLRAFRLGREAARTNPREDP
jgi:indolepyruvate ferredoxin oxidoreductase beta subunit